MLSWVCSLFSNIFNTHRCAVTGISSAFSNMFNTHRYAVTGISSVGTNVIAVAEAPLVGAFQCFVDTIRKASHL